MLSILKTLIFTVSHLFWLHLIVPHLFWNIKYLMSNLYLQYLRWCWSIVLQKKKICLLLFCVKNLIFRGARVLKWSGEWWKKALFSSLKILLHFSGVNYLISKWSTLLKCCRGSAKKHYCSLPKYFYTYFHSRLLLCFFTFTFTFFLTS